MDFLLLVETSARVASRGAKLDKIRTLVDLIQNTPEPLLGPLISMLSGDLPSGKIGVGHKLLNASLPKPRLPATAESETTNDSALTLEEVLTSFSKVGAASGKGSTQAKIDLLSQLFGQANAQETDFLRRLLLGEIRQGALEGVVLEAVGEACQLPLPALRRAAMISGSVPEIARVAVIEGLEALERYQVLVFRPLKPMLAQPAESFRSVLEATGLPASEGRLSMEAKIDGARVQVHRQGKVVKIYSRTLKEVTSSLPELEELALGLEAHSFILDGEAFCPREDGTPLPFQTTMRRFGRVQNVESLRESLPLTAHFFDCLYLEGRQLIDSPNWERYEKLDSLLPAAHRVARKVISSEQQAQDFVQDTLSAGHEGCMVKVLGEPYAAGSRGKSWFKVKPVHTLDLVILAAEWGHGRRQGKLSNLHLGARNSKGEWMMLGKTFKGLTDKMLAFQTEVLLELEKERTGNLVSVRPELVVEIAFNNVQKSPQYPGGVALRFARVKAHRTDKSPEDADSFESVLEIMKHEHE